MLTLRSDPRFPPGPLVSPLSQRIYKYIVGSFCSRGAAGKSRYSALTGVAPPAHPLHVTGLSRPAYGGRLMNTDKLAGCRPAL